MLKEKVASFNIYADDDKADKDDIEEKIPSEEVEETSQGAEVYAGKMMMMSLMIIVMVLMKIYPQ